MPLPLPQLDTRRYADLVDEGVARIPVYAPPWTDHNAHDPGITLLELLAWVVEQEIYRANRISERQRRKFLALVGFPSAPPQPAQTTLTFRLENGAGQQTLPAGLVFATGSGTAALPFRLKRPLVVVPLTIKAVQTHDGAAFLDAGQAWQEGLPFYPFGLNPAAAPAGQTAAGPALYLGLDAPLPAGVPVTFWFWLGSGGHDQRERQRLEQEAQAAEQACRSMRPPSWLCAPIAAAAWCPAEDAPPPPTGNGAGPAALLAHHGLAVRWEYYDGNGWHPLDASAGEVVDETRAFTLDGAVTFKLSAGAPMATAPLGKVDEPYFYLRCLLLEGRPDIAPQIIRVALNAIDVEQATAGRATLEIARGVTLPAGQKLNVGVRQRLALTYDANFVVSALAADPAAPGAEVLVLDYRPASNNAPGSITTSPAFVGLGNGRPAQQVTLPGAPLANGQAQIWSISGANSQPWEQHDDLDAADRLDFHFSLAPTTGVVTFGDGERGRVVPAGAPILAAYDTTAGAVANIPARRVWRLLGADDALNTSLLGGNVNEVRAMADKLAEITNPLPAIGGADEEMLFHAAGRAAERLWAHERLVELLPTGGEITLDQLERDAVVGRAEPQRALTLPDVERLALTVPGTWVRRTRAWAGLDLAYPCLRAPGTVTLIVLPELPRGRPEPTPGLLRAVRRYLGRRRTIGMRLVIQGPQYLEVTVRATVQAAVGADATRVQDDIVVALNRFLDPLQGGPDGRGWPFGRDVYRAEILQVIDGVARVDHVLALELLGDQGEAQCSNLCLYPTWLVTPGAHEISIVQ